ncbi:uncharacterized protein BX664DRAFT_337212 [Halteromyces radiatus]|uniref:uncharacterized protein n=1 Tax=Halteromyces radiatus TaxID=101107 RepID=UPI0022204183|nr:uncharacterized protein BX664DRAFT_337212 [Halteromyces radiatus]KAI8084539.1 hypothetical protein BX664DRAFT_337212 [Halteromyces radiatus]
MTEVIAHIPKSFANNFWGKDDAGYAVLSSKMANSKKTFEDLKSFYTARSSLHEEFGKKLLKQLKNDLGRDETGTLGILLASAYRELEMTAQSNIELAQKIKVNLELRLDNFILEQKDKRKLVQTTVDKAHRNKQLHAAHVAKAKEKYETECAKQISYEAQLSTAGLREADRLRQKLERCTHDIGIFEQEYKSACHKLADATSIWDTEWKNACDKYQEMEEKRVEFMHHSFSVYVNILSTTTNHDQESYERFWQALDQCDPKKDIETFIDEKGTGPMIPGPPVYVHYMDDPAKTLPTYHIAQFSDSDKSSSPTDTSKSGDHPNEISAKTPKMDPKQRQPSTTMENSSESNSHREFNDAIPVKKATATRSSSVQHVSSPQQRIAKQLPAIDRKPSMITSQQVRRKPTYIRNSNDDHRRSASTTSSRTPSVQNDHSSLNITDSSEEEEISDDVEIDPRAKVVFAIGNNIFEVDHRQQHEQYNQQHDQHRHYQSSRGEKKEPTTTRISKNGNDGQLDDSFDLSIKELLEELGVYSGNNNEQQLDRTDRTGFVSSVNSDMDKRAGEGSTKDNHSYPQQHQQPSMYTQLQQNYSSIGSTQGTRAPSSYYSSNGTSPPPKQDGIQWARALYDYQSTDGCLTFLRGNWLAIVRIESDSWCLAYLWDETTESLSTTCGYVASHLIQFVQ